jgi:hypothetical protein
MTENLRATYLPAITAGPIPTALVMPIPPKPPTDSVATPDNLLGCVRCRYASGTYRASMGSTVATCTESEQGAVLALARKEWPQLQVAALDSKTEGLWLVIEKGVGR